MKNSNRIKLGVVLLTTALLFSTCKKSTSSDPNVVADTTLSDEKVPVASFSSDKSTYTAGETINLTSTCADAATIRWTLPDGTTSNAASVSYQTDAKLDDTKLNFRLDAISKSGLKSDYTVKGISVNAIKGSIVLYYSSSFSGGQFVTSVSIDGMLYGTVSVPNTPDPPTCGQTGFPTIDLKVGFHSLIINNTKFLTVEVKNNQCTVVNTN